jgi:hypothetical protein
MTEANVKLRIAPHLNRNGKKPINCIYPGIGEEESSNYFTKNCEYDRGN